MSETCNRMKANLKLQGKACIACDKELSLGEDVAVCNKCDAIHHESCWDSSGGCGTKECANAPLKKLEEVPQLDSTQKKCPACVSQIDVLCEICPYCNAITTPDGLYHGPKENAPGAVAALVYGILGLLICGVIFGAVAISKSNSAKQAMAGDPRLEGSGLATAGLVLGIIDIVLWAIIIIARVGGAQ